MCKVGKKEWSEYMRNKRTKEFIKKLSELVGIPTGSLIESDNLGKMRWVLYKDHKGTKEFITELSELATIVAGSLVESK